MKNGFTLVELSIVLVIIGLLIGGILVGQSLIDTAKTNSLIRKISQYSIAVVNFKQKFKQLPGDSTRFSPAGSGDNQVYNPGIYCPTLLAEEIMVWAHLTQAQMISETYTYDTGVLCPSISGDYSNSGPLFQEIDYSGNKYPLTYYYTTGLVDPTYPFHAYFWHKFDPQLVSAMDNKLDDKNPDTGSVASWYIGGGGSCTLGNYSAEAAANSSVKSMSDALCDTYLFFSPGTSPEMPITP